MKKSYEKPEVRKVKLVPSEAVLTSCKAPTAGGPQFTGCSLGTHADPCSAIGS